MMHLAGRVRRDAQEPMDLGNNFAASCERRLFVQIRFPAVLHTQDVLRCFKTSSRVLYKTDSDSLSFYFFCSFNQLLPLLLAYWSCNPNDLA